MHEVEPVCRVVVVSDDPVYRGAVITLLTLAGHEAFGCETSIEAPPGRDDGIGVAMLSAEQLAPDPGPQIMATSSTVGPVVVIAGDHDPGHALRFLDAGAQGYLSRRASARDFERALKTIRSGEVHISDDLSRAMVTRMVRPPAAAPSLTPRERQVAALLSAGRTTDQIARALFIGGTTAKTHLRGIYAKLGVNSRAAAVARLAELGMLAELLAA
jgi:DNA-binding NarL/FixJ family response regulator